MQNLGSTNAIRIFTSFDYPSITTQAFSVILVASESSSYLDVAKY